MSFRRSTTWSAASHSDLADIKSLVERPYAVYAKKQARKLDSMITILCLLA